MLAKLKSEKDAYEQKYIDAKMQLSEVSMKHADLERELFRLKPK
jgi:hypothetical protein